MTKRSLAFRQTLNHAYKSMSGHRHSRKLFFWLAGLAIASGSLTLAQAGHIGANSAANGASGASVGVRTTSTDNSEPKSKTEAKGMHRILEDSGINVAFFSLDRAAKEYVGDPATQIQHLLED